MRNASMGIVFGVLAVAGIIAGIVDPCTANSKDDVIEAEPLVLHFDSGKMQISDADKSKIRHLLGGYEVGAEDKILVVGHTDSSGEDKKNIQLSYRRAQAVRREIISGLGVVGKNILAIGRGPENPVADNTTRTGRAQNRRVEIYLAQVVDGRLKNKARRIDMNQAAIEALVQDARSKLHHQQIRDALRILNQAHGLGGDKFSSWHAVFGIAGYYADLPADKIRAHLQTALRLDPFNYEARDYLGRMEAREKVLGGLVTPDMGRTAQDPIAVFSDSQVHEYLRLFNVQAIGHHQLVPRPVEVWRCRDPQGHIVYYHFDRSRVYDRCFT